jgi:antitoxin HicB
MALIWSLMKTAFLWRLVRLCGCVSQGRTRAEATENIREAIEGYLKNLRKHGDPVPPSILEEVIEIPEKR